MNHLRVLSYNIHKGFNVSGRYFVLKQLRESIRNVNADIVFLQEVVGKSEAHRRRIKDYPVSSQIEYLAEGIWSHHVYGKNAVYSDGHHGNAILSKFTVDKWHNLDLSTNRWEKRGLLHATLAISKTKKLQALSLHLDLSERGRRIQIQKVCAYIKENFSKDDNLILAGDFNDWREVITKRLQTEVKLDEVHYATHKKHARSFPSFFPVLCLDRIYFRRLTPIDAYILKDKKWSKLSDHSALYAEFKLK